MLEVGKTYRSCFEKNAVCTVIDSFARVLTNHPTHYKLLWLTTSGNTNMNDEAGKIEWELARDAENYLEEI